MCTVMRELSGGELTCATSVVLISSEYTLRPLISQLEDTGGTEYCVSGEARTCDIPITCTVTCRRYSGFRKDGLDFPIYSLCDYHHLLTLLTFQRQFS